jgi:hypothetical protein
VKSGQDRERLILAIVALLLAGKSFLSRRDAGQSRDQAFAEELL